MDNNVIVNTIRSTMFGNAQLNLVADQIIRLDSEYREQLRTAEKSMRGAFATRFTIGKLVIDNYEAIIEECGSQKAFAEAIGQSESQLSNTVRGYRYLAEAGADTLEKAVQLLQDKGIKPTSQNYERIGTMLAEPTPGEPPALTESKMQRRLEQIHGELEEIVRYSERATDPVVQETTWMIEFLQDTSNHLRDQNIFTRPFKSERYLNFVRTFGRDVITREPVARCDPHHTDFKGGSGGMGMKLPDWMTIPVSRTTHEDIEEGRITLTERELMLAMIETLATFVVNALDGRPEN